MKNIGILLLLISGIILTIGDVIMKEWTRNNKFSWFSFGMIFYIVASVLISYSFKYKNIAIATMIYVVFNVFLLTVISWFYFKEKMNLMDFIGLGMGLASIMILELAHNN